MPACLFGPVPDLSLPFRSKAGKMRYIVNTFYLLRFTLMAFQANREEGRYHQKVRRRAGALLRRSRELNDGSIPEKAYLKIQWYMVSTLFTGKLAAHLAGARLGPGGEEAYCRLGALIGLSDILVDDYRLPGARIEALLHQAGETAIGQVFHLYYQALLQAAGAGRAEALEKGMLQLIRFQHDSLRQFDAAISRAETEAATLGKGGASLQLCAALLPVRIDSLQQAFYELGGFIQAMNDAQDMHKDARDGVTTFVRFCSSFQEVQAYLEARRRACFRRFRALPLGRLRKGYFLFCFNAMHVLINYKLNHYARLCGGELDFAKIAAGNSRDFRTDPFSIRFVRACLGRILAFDPQARE